MGWIILFALTAVAVIISGIMYEKKKARELEEEKQRKEREYREKQEKEEREGQEREEKERLQNLKKDKARPAFDRLKDIFDEYSSISHALDICKYESVLSFPERIKVCEQLNKNIDAIEYSEGFKLLFDESSKDWEVNSSYYSSRDNTTKKSTAFTRGLVFTDKENYVEDFFHTLSR